jgi:hypothetical protein
MPLNQRQRKPQPENSEDTLRAAKFGNSHRDERTGRPPTRQLVPTLKATRIQKPVHLTQQHLQIPQLRTAILLQGRGAAATKVFALQQVPLFRVVAHAGSWSNCRQAAVSSPGQTAAEPAHHAILFRNGGNGRGGR